MQQYRILFYILLLSLSWQIFLTLNEISLTNLPYYKQIKPIIIIVNFLMIWLVSLNPRDIAKMVSNVIRMCVGIMLEKPNA